MRAVLQTITALLALATVTVAAPSGRPQAPARQTVPTGLHAPALEEKLDRWFLKGMDSIYRSRPTEAARIAEAMLEAAPEDPRPYLLKARVMRLDVSDQSFDRGGLKVEVAPIDALLDRVIEASNRILEEDPDSVAGLLYRGWAQMFKSQLRALSYEYWGAGRKAKAGKKDLDRVLKLDPGNADAQLVQGTYLYFADILPGVVKLASFLVRIPGGDLERGLQYLESAAQKHGYGRLDAQALLGVVLFGFEGRLEDAVEKFDAVDAKYPDNARIVEPLAVIDLFFPERLGRELPRVQRAVRINADSPEPWVRDVAARLRLYEALMELLTGEIELARSNLELLHADRPARPDWLETSILLNLADVYLMLGQKQEAVRLLDAFPAEHELRERLVYVLEEDSSSDPSQRQVLLEIQPAVQSLYAGRFDVALQGLERAGHLQAPFLDFYRGELEMLRGRHAEALQHFERLTLEGIPARWRLFRYFAFLRIAEIRGALGDDRAAAKSLHQAIDFHADRDLIRHVTRARERYFKNGRPGLAPVERAEASGVGTASRTSMRTH